MLQYAGRHGPALTVKTGPTLPFHTNFLISTAFLPPPLIPHSPPFSIFPSQLLYPSGEKQVHERNDGRDPWNSLLKRRPLLKGLPRQVDWSRGRQYDQRCKCEHRGINMRSQTVTD